MRKAFTAIIAGLILAVASAAVKARVTENNLPDNMPAWAMAAYAQAMQAAVLGVGLETIPTTVPTDDIINDPTGEVESYQPNGATDTSSNAFFQSLGTNGRSCFSCHEPQDGWTITPADALARFKATKGTDPVFNLVDGATCPDDKAVTTAQKKKAYNLLLTKGLIRIFLPLPSAGLEFEISSIKDPYKCTSLSSSTAGTVSVYRRPLPVTNLSFARTLMWDGREPDLDSQATDATLIHAQAAATPTADELTQITDFETGIYTAQSAITKGGSLTTAGAAGGAITLSAQPAIVNDPTLPGFSPGIFDPYTPWDAISGKTADERFEESVARGQTLFNTLVIDISGVAGLNDVLGETTITGTCGTCHNAPNAGNRSVDGTMDIGVSEPSQVTLTPVSLAGLPTFTLQCTSGPLAGTTFTTTDPGRALITGNCGDVDKFKVPSLRGLAARAPYFHNGSAASLKDVIIFYVIRFGIDPIPTTQQITDLANFLGTL